MARLLLLIITLYTIACISSANSIATKDLILSTLGHTHDALSFARFAQRYGKSYESAEEINHRFGLFMDNLKIIRSTNKKGLSYKLGINKFTDMSWDEFRSTRLGAAQKCSATLKGNHILTNAPIPQTRDWREEGIVSPVKNQGNCGSCWTFTTGKNITLSEQQLVDCAQAFNNNGCQGGLPSQAFQYVRYNGGLDTETSYPYQATDGKCSYKQANIGVKVIDTVNITMDAEDELKHAVGVVRPVSIAFEVVNSFMSYKSGVYSSDTCGSSPMDVNHAVLAVGYGVEKGVPYWLVKNSWGADWGMDGYFKMVLGKNMCGVATCASYPVVSA
ncbi:hypothetical protein J5N97_009382 [Dioscorea zingiberensis]|uniref:Uncharacterized protein n=1 Tax=Dioscorea zingiberensis TaxID=325984 RepID=A0A9D5CY45_9LILI|nr:hypothetical protein J5N97_009382 [Dioscorea zingiberensis]